GPGRDRLRRLSDVGSRMDARKLQQAVKPADIAVFLVTHDAKCDDCGIDLPSGGMLLVEPDKTALCLDCADLGHLEFLPSGDPALTPRASKHSTKQAAVVQWTPR